jgi:hypothetical protein
VRAYQPLSSSDLWDSKTSSRQQPVRAYQIFNRPPFSPLATALCESLSASQRQWPVRAK